jgi:F-type H+-transporting ATPase subunit b
MDPLQINVTRMGGSVNIDIDLTVFIQLGLFLVLMLILNKLVFQPFLRSNELREARTDKAREDAADIKARAEKLSTEYREALAAARADAAADRQALRTDGLSNKDTQVSAAREAAASTLAAAQAKASSQFDEARQALLADVDALSKQVAGKVLGRGV